MAHRRSLEEGKRLWEKELRLREMQSAGKNISSSRRRKKYLQMIRKQQGFLAYLRARGGLKIKESKNEG